VIAGLPQAKRLEAPLRMRAASRWKIGMSKTRADQLLVDRGLAESRTRAQALIMAGLVFAGDRKIDKPGQAVADDVVLDVRALVDLIVCDASFIGLAKVLEVPLRFAKPEARLLALIKPQFEAGRTEVGKGGVVRDPAVHARVCAEVSAWVVAQGWSVATLVESPITGPEGNIEFLIAATR